MNTCAHHGAHVYKSVVKKSLFCWACFVRFGVYYFLRCFYKDHIIPNLV